MQHQFDQLKVFRPGLPKFLELLRQTGSVEWMTVRVARYMQGNPLQLKGMQRCQDTTRFTRLGYKSLD